MAFTLDEIEEARTRLNDERRALGLPEAITDASELFPLARALNAVTLDAPVDVNPLRSKRATATAA